MVKWLQVDDDDERMLAAFMKRVAAVPTTRQAGDAMQLWWKAQLLRRWDAERRAQLPLDVMQPIEIAAGLGVAAALLYLSVPYLF